MHDAHFSNPTWYLALGLSERAHLLSRDERISASAVGHKRLDRWKSQRPFVSGEWLERRLSSDGLDLPAFAGALALSASELQTRAPRPDWLTGLESAFAGGSSSEITHTTFAFSSDDHSTSSLLNLVGPLLESARSRLRAALSPLEGRPPIDIDRTAHELISIIARRALYSIERALVLEMHIAKLEDRLTGDTPEARFENFARGLAEKDRSASVLAQYPVLARRVVEGIDDGVVAATEFATRLVEDWPEIRATFFTGADPGRLVEIDAHAGDPHRRGRSVAIAKFESGARLVYKPRSLDVDVHYQEFLSYLNARLDGPAFRTLAVLARSDHGWMEFVDARPCATSEDARRYYWRVGGLLAALHALRGVDCHFENIIAHGDQPVLVDVETLLHPAIPHREPERHDRRFASRVLARSVLRVGLLPVPVGGGGAAVDLSGLASVEGALSPDRVLQWERTGTDEMHAVRVRVEMPGADNRARLHDRVLDPVEYRDDVAAGFAAVYRLIVRERDALLAPGGAVSAFAKDRVRAVVRATRGYGMLLAESLHPDLLRDAIERDRFFDRLWVGVDQHPVLARVVGAEHRDLSRADVPYFSCRPDSRDLWTSDGERIADFFERPAIDLVRQRLLGMDDGDLVRQQWFVTLSLGSLAAAEEDSHAGESAPVARRSAHRVDHVELRARMLEQAVRIGERLGEIAVWDGDDVAWVTLEFRERKWSLEPVSNDLYVGLPGVAVFLGYLVHVSRRRGLPLTAEREHLARAAAHTIVRTTADSDFTLVGAFSGWGGILYALTHLATVWRDPDLRGACDRIVRRIDVLAAGDEDTDVVGGLAGAIGVLCAAHMARVSDAALGVATRCGEQLIARAQSAESGMWWHTRLAGDTPSTGFSHGNAGMAWALLTLAEATGDDRFLRAGLSATAFERERLRAIAGSANETSLVATWCYGPPGIGISRLSALRGVSRHGGSFPGITRDGLRADIDEAVRATLENGFGRNHCLCHGDLGNLDFLFLAAGETSAPVTDAIPGIAQDILDRAESSGWLCGTPAHVPSPGLMNGFAGIGYGLLRMVEPALVPSVLALEPPVPTFPMRE
jgi:type 2 lantibiotic biosynthesis protein LanM